MMKLTINVIRFTSSLILLCGFIAMGSCQNHNAAPAARYGAKMVYDPVGEQIILFGGRADGLFGMKYFNDLWKFDSATQIWSSIRATNPPPGRISPGMAYDAANQQIILFGGDSPRDRLSDTWIYNLAENRWQDVTPQVSPPPRSDMGFVYDETNRIVILFGGYCSETVHDLCDDTWVFDPQTRIWTEMNPTNSPPVMYGQAMLYDWTSQKILLWGGHELHYRNGEMTSHNYGNSFWNYDSAENTWKQAANSKSPPARYWHQLVLDSSDGKLLLFGGNGNQGFLSDTWTYNLTKNIWQQEDLAVHPSARVNPAMSYDPVNRNYVLFGGMAEDSTALGDTWIYQMNNDKGEWLSIP
jgi:N-acetylneuraminic acid mutarotase